MAQAVAGTTGIKDVRRDAETLTKRVASWVGIRGAVALVFGIVLLAFPEISLAALVLTFGAVAFVDGIAMLATAIAGRYESGRGWMVLNGTVSVLTGFAVVVWPDISALALLYVIGAWAIVAGLLQIASAFELLLDGGERVLLVLSGLLSIAFGTIMWIHPGAGALALVTLIAAFAIVTGTTLLVAGYRIRRHGGVAAARVVERLGMTDAS
jgi:uncharacterized membrane protein HdeD (DUF308 family)